jgi:hypothetical protein
VYGCFTPYKLAVMTVGDTYGNNNLVGGFYDNLKDTFQSQDITNDLPKSTNKNDVSDGSFTIFS